MHTDSRNIDTEPVCFHAHKSGKTVTPTLLKTVLIFFHSFISLANVYGFAKKLLKKF